MAKVLDSGTRPQGIAQFGIPGIHTEGGDMTGTSSWFNLAIPCRWFRLVIFQRGFAAGSSSVSQYYTLEGTSDSNQLAPLGMAQVALPRRVLQAGVSLGFSPLTLMSQVRIVCGTQNADTLSYDYMIDATP